MTRWRGARAPRSAPCSAWVCSAVPTCFEQQGRQSAPWAERTVSVAAVCGGTRESAPHAVLAGSASAPHAAAGTSASLPRRRRASSRACDAARGAPGMARRCRRCRRPTARRARPPRRATPARARPCATPRCTPGLRAAGRGLPPGPVLVPRARAAAAPGLALSSHPGPKTFSCRAHAVLWEPAAWPCCIQAVCRLQAAASAAPAQTHRAPFAALTPAAARAAAGGAAAGAGAAVGLGVPRLPQHQLQGARKVQQVRAPAPGLVRRSAQLQRPAGAGPGRLLRGRAMDAGKRDGCRRSAVWALAVCLHYMVAV